MDRALSFSATKKPSTATHVAVTKEARRPARREDSGTATAAAAYDPVVSREHDELLRSQALRLSKAAPLPDPTLRPIENLEKLTVKHLESISIENLERIAISDLSKLTISAEAFNAVDLKDWTVPGAADRYSKAIATIQAALSTPSDAAAAPSSSKMLADDGCDSNIVKRLMIIEGIYTAKTADPIPHLLLSKAPDTEIVFSRAVCKAEHDQFQMLLSKGLPDDDDFGKYFKTQKWFSLGEGPQLNDLGDTAHDHLIQFRMPANEFVRIVTHNFVVDGLEDGKAYRNTCQLKSNETSNIGIGEQIFQELAQSAEFKAEALGKLALYGRFRPNSVNSSSG